MTDIAPSRPLAMTMGEPAGIGLEIALAAHDVLRPADGPVFFLIADPALLRARARRVGADTPVVEIDSPADAADAFAEGLPVLALPAHRDLPDSPGRPTAGTAPAVLAAIGRAVDLALAGAAAAIVTLPIQKETLYAAGFAGEGHT
ncbi:MAG TPA: 4-hydroxythreonine-4-phosphate dehydrogenase, partial [Thermopetrobacter sp.]|nr:4-hydroxythreonine-4-phosphate dehydrogenase [Thermopetrobacter sp.]